MFDSANISALELVSLILLSQQLKISIDFKLLLIIEFSFHAGQSMRLCLLCNASFESLILYAFLKEANLITVVSFNCINHEAVLKSFAFLVLLILSLFL